MTTGSYATPAQQHECTPYTALPAPYASATAAERQYQLRSVWQYMELHNSIAVLLSPLEPSVACWLSRAPILRSCSPDAPGRVGSTHKDWVVLCLWAQLSAAYHRLLLGQQEAQQ
jgi:hypothetical protein